MLGLGAARLEADMNSLMTQLFHQGVLDEQFTQLQQLQDESSPNFVSEVISIYFRESEKLLKNLRSLLADRDCTDYSKIGIHLNQLMGSSSSVGAKRVRNVCLALRAASEHGNWSGVGDGEELPGTESFIPTRKSQQEMDSRSFKTLPSVSDPEK